MKRIPHAETGVAEVPDPEAYQKAHQKSARQQFKPFLKCLDGLNVRGRCLEMGAGSGILACMIAERFPKAEITAVEPDPRMIELGQRNVRAKGLDGQVRFVAGQAEDEAFLQSLGTFPLVYSTFSLHHWENPVAALAALNRCVAEDGVLVIFDLKRTGWLYYLPKQTGLIRSIRAAYTLKEMRGILAEARLTNVKTWMPFPWFWQMAVVKKNGNLYR